MRQRKGRRKWNRHAAAVLAVLFLIVGGRACLDGRQDGIQEQSLSWKNRWEREILRGALMFYAPALGDVWQWSKEQWESIDPSLQTLLLEEQKLITLEQKENQEKDLNENGEEEQDVQSIMAWEQMESIAPEDLAELVLTERDADLLAEIDRENEAMRQQATILQSQQSLQEGVLPLSLPYTREQLGSMDYLKEHIYNVNRGTQISEKLLDADTLLAMDMTWEAPDSGGPKVLIHHTHATEYFADSNQKDETTLIVGVGDYLEELLESRYGIEVIHDRTVYPYNEAYSQALKNVESILAENPTIEVFIDLHRDAGGTKKYTVNVEGKEMAHLMFFNGLSHSAKGPIDYLPNENQQANLAFSFQMKMAGDSLYPGLCKRNYLKAYRYNLHVLPRAVIVEVGDNNNTLQEAKNAMEPLARILHLILTGRE